jgi:hypothetical protein
MDNKQKDKKKYHPMSVGISDEELFSEKSGDIWEKKHSLPQKVQDILMSEEIVDFIYLAEKKYQLQDQQTENFSRNIRQYFFGEITEMVFINNVAEICNILPQESLKIINAIKNINPKAENDEKQIISLSLNEVFKKYPEITNQIITNKNIITKPFLKPLKPTVKNWIIVYEKILGVGTHTAIERGEFVFRAKATEGLSEKERNNLLILFKARDENSKLNIDLDEEKIIFEVEKNKKDKKNKQNKVNSQIIKQKVVKEEIKKEKQIQIKPQIQKIKNSQLHKFSNSQNIDTENVNNINEKDNENKSKQNITNIDDKNVLQEVEEEINKNRTEMTNKQIITKKPENLIEKEKIGSQTYQIDNSIKKTSKIVGTPVKQNDISKKYHKNTTINNKKNKIQQKGIVSFSSNHVMPAEREKQNKKQNMISPIGFNSN